MDQEERSECGDGLGDGWFGTGPNCYNLMRYYEYFQVPPTFPFYEDHIIGF